MASQTGREIFRGSMVMPSAGLRDPAQPSLRTDQGGGI